ncbi:hypothetical protein BJV77DRAFT_103919 [Russula vinacea]|nr:hypothetical protein BJV77DRAFT_103919 [Russula vinacea]
MGLRYSGRTASRRHWWFFTRDGSVRTHPRSHHLVPGLRLEQTPKTNFWTPLRGFALLTVRSVPPSLILFFPCFLVFSILLSLPFSYCRCVLLTIRLILVRLTYCMRLLFFHHATLTTIANATHSNMFTVSTITILETNSTIRCK